VNSPDFVELLNQLGIALIPLLGDGEDRAGDDENTLALNKQVRGVIGIFNQLHLLIIVSAAVDQFSDALPIPDEMYDIARILSLILSTTDEDPQDQQGQDATLLEKLANDVSRAQTGNINPRLTRGQYIDKLGLKDSTSDGRTLIERLLNDRIPTDVTINLLNSLIRDMMKLLVKLESHQELNSAEDAVVGILTGIFEQQLLREGTSCNLSVKLAKRLTDVRPYSFSTEVVGLLQKV